MLSTLRPITIPSDDDLIEADWCFLPPSSEDPRLIFCVIIFKKFKTI